MQKSNEYENMANMHKLQIETTLSYFVFTNNTDYIKDKSQSNLGIFQRLKLCENYTWSWTKCQLRLRVLIDGYNHKVQLAEGIT